MTQEQINPIIEKERIEGEAEIRKLKGAFYNAPYAGPDLPVNFVKLFKGALYNLAPMSDNISSKGLEDWVKKENAELNFGEVMKMTEIIASVPRKELFPTLEKSFRDLHLIEMVMKDVREKNFVFTNEQQKREDDLKRELHKRRFELQNMPANGGSGHRGNSKKKNKKLAVVN